jgi:hypothetical protein
MMHESVHTSLRFGRCVVVRDTNGRAHDGTAGSITTASRAGPLQSLPPDRLPSHQPGLKMIMGPPEHDMRSD